MRRCAKECAHQFDYKFILDRCIYVVSFSSFHDAFYASIYSLIPLDCVTCVLLLLEVVD